MSARDSSYSSTGTKADGPGIECIICLENQTEHKPCKKCEKPICHDCSVTQLTNREAKCQNCRHDKYKWPRPKPGDPDRYRELFEELNKEKILREKRRQRLRNLEKDIKKSIIKGTVCHFTIYPILLAIATVSVWFYIQDRSFYRHLVDVDNCVSSSGILINNQTNEYLFQGIIKGNLSIDPESTDFATLKTTFRVGYYQNGLFLENLPLHLFSSDREEEEEYRSKFDQRYLYDTLDCQINPDDFTQIYFCAQNSEGKTYCTRSNTVTYFMGFTVGTFILSFFCFPCCCIHQPANSTDGEIDAIMRKNHPRILKWRFVIVRWQY